ncbi:MAG: Holliday junction resolvase RuvX [Clostridia bacterium]|nr:Holliday junction resolvase RuvX [Clostridia bacterium]
MRIMALDYGEQRIGVALTDLMKILASPFEVYHRKHTEEDFNHFLEVIKNQQVDTIVLGLPLNPEGEEQEIAKKVREFGEELKAKANCKIVYFDERMSSYIAEDILKQKEKDWKKRKEKLDMFAAMVILQDYLDSL